MFCNLLFEIVFHYPELLFHTVKLCSFNLTTDLIAQFCTFVKLQKTQVAIGFILQLIFALFKLNSFTKQHAIKVH